MRFSIRSLWYCALVGLSTACVSESVIPIKETAEVMQEKSRSSLVLSDVVAKSPYIHSEMRNAECQLLDESAFRAEILKQVNALRAQPQVCGHQIFPASQAVVWNAQLQMSAFEHAAQMAVTNLFSHTSLDGRELRDRALAAGYDYLMLGENIAAGQVDITAVVQAWLKSPSHCAQMLRPEFSELAVACVAKRHSFYTRYWVMNLGRPRHTN